MRYVPTFFPAAQGGRPGLRARSLTSKAATRKQTERGSNNVNQRKAEKGQKAVNCINVKREEREGTSEATTMMCRMMVNGVMKRSECASSVQPEVCYVGCEISANETHVEIQEYSRDRSPIPTGYLI